MYDGMNQTGSPIGLFKSAKSIWLNELDSDGTPHGFANVNEGDLIELFVHGEADYGLFTVVAIHDESDGDIKYWVIDVEFVRALNPESKADNADSLRVKVIQPPSAEGESSDRYLLNGDVTTLTATSTILAHSNGKWMNIQAAANNSSGFFVFRDYNGTNIFQVRGDGEITLKPGRLATSLDEITTKRYVDSKLGSGGGGSSVVGRRFKYSSSGDYGTKGNFSYGGGRLKLASEDLDGGKVIHSSNYSVNEVNEITWSSNLKFTIRDSSGYMVVMGEASGNSDYSGSGLRLRVPDSMQSNGTGPRYGSFTNLQNGQYYQITVEGYF